VRESKNGLDVKWTSAKKRTGSASPSRPNAIREKRSARRLIARVGGKLKGGKTIEKAES